MGDGAEPDPGTVEVATLEEPASPVTVIGWTVHGHSALGSPLGRGAQVRIGTGGSIPHLDRDDLAAGGKPGGNTLGDDLSHELERTSTPEHGVHRVAGKTRLDDTAVTRAASHQPGDPDEHSRRILRCPVVGSQQHPVGVDRHGQGHGPRRDDVAFGSHLDRSGAAGRTDVGAEAAAEVLHGAADARPESLEPATSAGDAPLVGGTTTHASGASSGS